MAEHERRTPGDVCRLALRFDTCDRPFAANAKDTVFCYASLKDKSGTVVPDIEAPVFFGSTGQARLIGHNPVLSEAGTATILVQSDSPNPLCAVYAISLVREKDRIRVLSASATPDGTATPTCTIRYTTDGTMPSADSPMYSTPVKNTPHLRAAILVQNQAVAIADARATASSTSGQVAWTTKAPPPVRQSSVPLKSF